MTQDLSIRSQSTFLYMKALHRIMVKNIFKSVIQTLSSDEKCTSTDPFSRLPARQIKLAPGFSKLNCINYSVPYLFFLLDNRCFSRKKETSSAMPCQKILSGFNIKGCFPRESEELHILATIPYGKITFSRFFEIPCLLSVLLLCIVRK
jgi:hypothetical protein